MPDRQQSPTGPAPSQTLRTVSRIATGLLVASLVFIVVAEGLGTLFSAPPILLSFWLLRRFLLRYETSGFPLVAGAAASFLTTSAFTLWWAGRWMFDVHGTQTGSSTSALGMIFVPIYATFAGAAAFLGVSLVSLLLFLLVNRSR